VAQHLLESAIKTLFEERFPKIKKLERKDADGPYDALLLWFFESEGFELLEDFSDSMYRDQLDLISPLSDLLNTYTPEVDKETSYFLKELVLWGLVANNKLSKHSFSNGTEFKDLYGSYINGL
jgi:magnesium chelatase subunit I